MALPWPCHGPAMALPWPCHGIAIALPWHCQGIAMTLPWHCHSIAMALPWQCQRTRQRKDRGKTESRQSKGGGQGEEKQRKGYGCKSTWFSTVENYFLPWNIIFHFQLTRQTRSQTLAIDLKLRPTMHTDGFKKSEGLQSGGFLITVNDLTKYVRP